MPRTIEYCLSEVDGDAKRLLGDCDGEVVEKRCLQRCGDCYRHSFLVVDGELKTGTSHGDILRSLGGGDE